MTDATLNEDKNELGSIIYQQTDPAGRVICREQRSGVVVYWRDAGSDEELKRMAFVREDECARIFLEAGSPETTTSRFRRLTEIQLEGLTWNPRGNPFVEGRYGLLAAAELPKGFSGVLHYGVGIRKDFRAFFYPIEANTKCDTVRFTHGGDEGESDDGRTFTVGYWRFEEYRKQVNLRKARGATAVARVLTSERNNILADLLGLEEQDVKYGRNPMIKALTEEVEHGHITTASDRAALVEHVANQAAKVAEEAPERLYKLSSDIELVSLEALIRRFEADLTGPNRANEKHWQEFFEENQFALQQLFATPLVLVQREAHVRAADVTGAGSRIADFLCANPATRTAKVVEIKTPGAGIVARKPYRGRSASGVYAIHKDLSETYAQVQSQMESVQADLPARLGNLSTLEHWSDLRGAIILGTLSELNEEQLASFLRFRAGLTNVTILTYDEVLQRLKELSTALSTE